MPSRRDVEEAIAILGGGRLAQLGVGAIRRPKATARAAGRRLLPIAGRGAKFVGRQAITKNPWGIAALLVYEGYVNREELVDLAQSLGGTMQEAVEFYESETGSLPVITTRRKVSKANRAVAYGMKILKSGTKALTGADKGKLPKGAFKTATVAAGLANPKTDGSTKGKGKTKALARKIKGWW